MSGDKLVFDLANEVDDVPNVFVRKDWINILDNQNGNYNSNQSVIDTSQLSNSNKYMSYREAYVVAPLLLTMTSTVGVGVMPNSAAKSSDFSIGLKNWFGQIVHSLTLDFNGTTIIQQTPYINMWNSFKLMTSLSWQDVYDMGPTMGFYPDDPLSWSYQGADSLSGKGVCNNTNMRPPFNVLGPKLGISTAGSVAGNFGILGNNDNQYLSGLGNEGFLKRQLYIMYDADAPSGNGTYGADTLSGGSANALWKSRIITKTASAAAVKGVFQVAVTATIHLRHLHSFFNQIPLIKGAFMKLTLNLNNTTTTVRSEATTNNLILQNVQNAVGGVNPVMFSSAQSSSIGATSAGADAVSLIYYNGSAPLNKNAANATPLGANADYIVNISVGARCLNTQQVADGAQQSPLGQSIILYVPAYSFNAVFEQAYISSPIKKVIYEDIYQYQVLNVGVDGQINNLLTNGIANLRSILVLPFYSAGTNTHLASTGVPVYQSPFDPAGTGPTSPLSLLTNFNVVVSGQNAIYNTQRYSFEQFLNQTYGANSVNAGLTDGLSSSLINQLGWEMEYCYHYVDISRMLPVEQQVPKSVQIVGQNTSRQTLDLWCFLSYGCELSFDILSGSRV
jgi:hypothetical protein